MVVLVAVIHLILEDFRCFKIFDGVNSAASLHGEYGKCVRFVRNRVNQIALTSWRKIVLLELKFMSQTISNNIRFLTCETRTHQ